MAQKKKQWVREVKTVSTFPPRGLFTRDAETIARVMADRKVSPRGIASGIRMIRFFINRAGKSCRRSESKNWRKPNDTFTRKPPTVELPKAAAQAAGKPERRMQSGGRRRMNSKR
jgi:tRNA(adenine34) deaminase